MPRSSIAFILLGLSLPLLVLGAGLVLAGADAARALAEPARLKPGVVAPAPSGTAWSDQLFALGWKRETELEDYDGAIAAYEQVVRNNPKNRLLASRALIRLSECLRRKGRLTESREVLRRYWRLGRAGDDAMVPDAVRHLPDDIGALVGIDYQRVRATSVGSDWAEAREDPAKRAARDKKREDARAGADRARPPTEEQKKNREARRRAKAAERALEESLREAGVKPSRDLDRTLVGVRPSGGTVQVWVGADLRRRVEPLLRKKAVGAPADYAGRSVLLFDAQAPSRPSATFVSDRELVLGSEEDVRAALTARRAGLGRDAWLRPALRKLYGEVAADVVFFAVALGDLLEKVSKIDVPGLVSLPLPRVSGFVAVGNMDYDLALFFKLFTKDVVRAKALAGLAKGAIDGRKGVKPEDDEDLLEQAILQSLDIDTSFVEGALSASAHVPYPVLLKAGVVSL